MAHYSEYDILYPESYINLNFNYLQDLALSVKWSESETVDCQNPAVSGALLNELTLSPNIEKIHINVLIQLFSKFPEFEQLIATRGHLLPGLRNYGS